MAAQPEILNVVASFWKETAYMDNSVFLCKLAEHTRTRSFSLFRMGALSHTHTHTIHLTFTHTHTLSVSHSCTRTHSFCLFLPLTLALSPFLSHSFAPTQAYTNTIFCLSSHTNTLAHAHARTSTHTLAETNVFLICYLKVVPHNDEFLPWTELPLSPSRPYLYGHLEDFAFTWSWSWTGNLVEISGSIFSKLLSFNIKKRLSGWKKFAIFFFAFFVILATGSS